MDRNIWDTISPKAKDFIKRILRPEEKRISLEGAIMHPWFHFPSIDTNLGLLVKIEEFQESKEEKQKKNSAEYKKKAI